MIQIKANDYESPTAYLMKIGHRGEALTRQVIYDLTKLIEDLGDGSASFVYKNPEGVQYTPVHQRRVDNFAVWTIDATDASCYGQGLAELRFYPGSEGDDVYKTIVFRTFVAQSLGVPGPAPEPYEDVLEEMREIKDEAVGAKGDAEDARDAAAGSAEAAAGSAAEAESASEAVQNMLVESHSVPSGQDPTVEKTVDPQTGAVNLDFGIPSGTAGEGAVVYNADMSLTDAEKARARNNIGAGFFTVENGQFFWLVDEEE